MFLSSKNQVALIVLKSAHDFCTVSLLGVLRESSLPHSKLILHYVLIRLTESLESEIIINHMVEKLMNPNAEIQPLHSDGKSL